MFDTNNYLYINLLKMETRTKTTVIYYDLSQGSHIFIVIIAFQYTNMDVKPSMVSPAVLFISRSITNVFVYLPFFVSYTRNMYFLASIEKVKKFFLGEYLPLPHNQIIKSYLQFSDSFNSFDFHSQTVSVMVEFDLIYKGCTIKSLYSEILFL